MTGWYRRRHWVYLSLVCLLLLDGVVYFGWVRRLAGLPATEPAQLAALEREVGGRVAEVARLRRVRDQLPQLRPQLDKFTAERFPSERAGFSRVAEELDATASETGVQLGRVAYQSQEEKDRPELLRIEITTNVEGGYPNLLHYLEALERSPRFYLINELNVVGTEGGSVRVEMKLATYFRRSTT